ncbi:hypothetical protein [Aestuariivita sp.]|uniref:hypothetical protein n=1 Tax=Aestuariivita sp. TaxID=1872407 RepID=UPI002173E56A|nr:hypothetical protein [Aestuariivita sp.]MCE8009643.1 hypothetical protein [Aestuariivita sp.]
MSTAIADLDPNLREAAIGLGVRPMQRLRQVGTPLAPPVIIAGVRMAVVMRSG